MGFRLLAIAALFLSGCSSLMYQPYERLIMTPDMAGIIYEPVDFTASDGTKLKGWFIPAQKLTPPLKEGILEGAKSVKMKTSRATVVHFHGNGENRSTHYATLIWLIEHGYNLFTIDYRGYGGSEGKAEPEGVYRDGMAAIRWAKEHAPRGTDKKDLVMYGQSLGGAIMARCFEDVVDRSRIKAVVLESTFYSYQKIAADVLSRSWITWIFQPLGYALISDVTSPEKSYASISPIPLLVIHGEKDNVVPFRFGQEIFRRAQEPKTFWDIPRARHLNVYAVEQTRYQSELLKYFDAL